MIDYLLAAAAYGCILYVVVYVIVGVVSQIGIVRRIDNALNWFDKFMKRHYLIAPTIGGVFFGLFSSMIVLLYLVIIKSL